MKKLIATMLALVLALGVMSGCLAEEDRTLLIYCPQSRTEFADYVSQMAMDDLGITIEWPTAEAAATRSWRRKTTPRQIWCWVLRRS